MTIVAPAATLMALVGGIVSGLFLLKQGQGRCVPSEKNPMRRPPWATLVALTVIGSVSLLQLTVQPGLLVMLERDAAQAAAGQWWRLLTSLTVQDGGALGAALNLAFLAVLGWLAETTLGAARAVVAWGAGALTGELVGLAWQPIGAGNSVGSMGLAGALAVAALGARPRPTVPIAVGGLAAVILLAMRDLHGAAWVAGAAARAAGQALARRS